MKSLPLKIEVMQAHVAGRPVQITQDEGKTWRDVIAPEFNWGLCDYRIKPITRFNDLLFGDKFKTHKDAEAIAMKVNGYDVDCNGRVNMVWVEGETPGFTSPGSLDRINEDAEVIKL